MMQKNKYGGFLLWLLLLAMLAGCGKQDLPENRESGALWILEEKSDAKIKNRANQVKSRYDAGYRGAMEVIESAASKEEEWSPDSLKKGLLTKIDCNETVSDTYIPDADAAKAAIREWGERQRDLYDNPEVVKIERQMEKDYDLFAVNLGEMDVETAKDVERAFAYMYGTYPQLRGMLTNVTLGNWENFNASSIAETRFREFITNGEFMQPPFVVKHEIILGASDFLKRDRLLKKCRDMEECGHWPEGSDISSLVVHELGHQLLSAYIMKQVGFETIYYVTDENWDGYGAYITDGLSANQTLSKEVLLAAYENWEKENPGKEYADFAGSISEYAMGIQSDGGISYTETFAEAVTDVYLHGEDASRASILIAEEITNRFKSIEE